MKKVLALLLVCGLLFTLSGCFNSGVVDDAEDKLNSVAEDVLEGDVDLDKLEDSLEEYTSTIDGKIKGFDDIEEYVKASKESDAFKQSVEAVAEQGMALSIEADGNNLIYKYVYNVPVADNAKAIIEDSFKTNDSTFTKSADTIRVEAPCVEKVVWEYYTVDGELIASLEK